MQYVPSKVYFARLKHNGKLFRASLETTVKTVAEARLPDKIKELKTPKAPLGTFAAARLLYETDLENDHTLKDRSKKYRLGRLQALLRSWPGLDTEKLDDLVSKDAAGRPKRQHQFDAWAKAFAAKFDEQNFNNTLGTLRAIIQRGGVKRDDNPAYNVPRLGVKPPVLDLPETEQFDKLIQTIATAGARQSKDCADLVRFLAYSGCRISESRGVTWGDIDLEHGTIRVWNGKRSKESNQPETRLVPIIPPMRQLLERLKREHPGQPTDRVCVLGECQKSLTRACDIVGIPRLTHHDLRHLFASVCIESEIDMPTISRWLGHSDGGYLAMKVYGHLRERHSQAMAQKVTFGQPVAENIVQLPKQQIA